MLKEECIHFRVRLSPVPAGQFGGRTRWLQCTFSDSKFWIPKFGNFHTVVSQEELHHKPPAHIMKSTIQLTISHKCTALSEISEQNELLLLKSRVETLNTEETGYREAASAIDKFKKFRSRLQGYHSFASVNRILNNKIWRISIFKANFYSVRQIFGATFRIRIVEMIRMSEPFNEMSLPLARWNQGKYSYANLNCSRKAKSFGWLTTCKSQHAGLSWKHFTK